MKQSAQQLLLNVDFTTIASWENFLVEEENAYAVHTLRSLRVDEKSGKIIYLWGTTGSGKSHLLTALTNDYHGARYLAFSGTTEEIIKLNHEPGDEKLLALDDINHLWGNPASEQALFTCFNQCVDRKINLVLAARESPLEAQIILPDLKSRLLSGLVFYLNPLNDEQKAKLLQERAASDGVDLDAEVIQYLINHYERNTAKLFERLKLLERMSLVEQRRLTIPFVRDILSQYNR